MNRISIRKEHKNDDDNVRKVENEWEKYSYNVENDDEFNIKERYQHDDNE